MGSLFGTDGVRGIANQEPMTPETVVKLGRAVAHLFKAPGDRRSIVIGKDTRLTGYMLETALTAGITSMGVDVLLVGPLPTPGSAPGPTRSAMPTGSATPEGGISNSPRTRFRSG